MLVDMHRWCGEMHFNPLENGRLQATLKVDQHRLENIVLRNGRSLLIHLQTLSLVEIPISVAPVAERVGVLGTYWNLPLS